MAPEQLEGRDADARTDIFAFGAVLYEMLTGKKAFEGKSQASLIGAIMHEPPPIAVTQPPTPPVLDRIVKKCLAKDPDDRWQSAKDLCDELQWVAEAGSRAGVSLPVVARRASRERLVLGVAVIALVAVAALAIPAVRHVRESAPDPRSQCALRSRRRRPAIRRPSRSRPTAGSSRSWRRRRGRRGCGCGRSTRRRRSRSPGTDGASYPFWAPDGRAIGFFSPTAS